MLPIMLGGVAAMSRAKISRPENGRCLAMHLPMAICMRWLIAMARGVGGGVQISDNNPVKMMTP